MALVGNSTTLTTSAPSPAFSDVGQEFPWPHTFHWSCFICGKDPESLECCQ